MNGVVVAPKRPRPLPSMLLLDLVVGLVFVALAVTSSTTARAALVLPLEDRSPFRPPTPAQPEADRLADGIPVLQGRLPLEPYRNAIHTVPVRIGSQATPHRLMLDTASSDLWVWQPAAAPQLPDWVQAFDPAASTSWSATSVQCPAWKKSYRLGEVEGLLGKDRLQLAGTGPAPEVAQQVIALPCNYTNDGLLNQAAPFDGVWGLGYASQSEANRLLAEEGGAPTLLDNLFAQGQLDAKRFSFRLARKAGERSEFVLGREPRSYEPSGGWKWTDILLVSQLQISVQKISVDGKKTQACELGSCAALLSSSAPGVFIPALSWTEVSTQLMGASAADGTCKSSAGQIRCSQAGVRSLRSITFSVLDAGDYSFAPKDYVFEDPNAPDPEFPLLLAIQRTPASWGGHASLVVLGDLWLRRFYTVFDLERQRVGLPTPSSTAAVSGSEVGAALGVGAGILVAALGLVFIRHKFWPEPEFQDQPAGAMPGAGVAVGGGGGAGGAGAGWGRDVERGAGGGAAGGAGGAGSGSGRALGRGQADPDRLPPYLRPQ